MEVRPATCLLKYSVANLDDRKLQPSLLWTLKADYKLIRLIPFFVLQENTFLPFGVPVGDDDYMLDRIRYNESGLCVMLACCVPVVSVPTVRRACRDDIFVSSQIATYFSVTRKIADVMILLGFLTAF
jgi:hypothetical protein